MKQRIRYTNIPWTVVENKGLNPRAKIIYGVIQGFAKGECRVTDAYLAELLNVSGRAIQKDLKMLKDLNLIYTKFRTNEGKVVGRTLFVKGQTTQSNEPKEDKDGWV